MNPYSMTGVALHDYFYLTDKKTEAEKLNDLA